MPTPAGFYRQEIPACPGYGFETTQEFSTRVNELVSGRENRNGLWMYGRHRVAISWTNIGRGEFNGLRAFYYGMRGRLYAFMQRDWSDYQAIEEFTGVGDGSTTEFQVGKYYVDGPGYFRKIHAVDSDTFAVFKNGILVSPDDYTLDPDRGLVVFDTAPADGVAISWSGEFWLWARFDSDTLPVMIVDASEGDYLFSGSISILEVPPPPVEG